MISIRQCKDIRETLGMTHIVIFAVDQKGDQYMATHGDSRQHAREAAKAGNNLKKALGWPDNLCHDAPLQRICKNCAYYKPDYGYHCFNGWTKHGEDGECQVEPTRSKTAAESTCRYFEPH